MIRTIIFDLDGTLIESLTSIVKSMNYLLEKEGYPSHPFESYRMFVGDGVEKLIERAFPSLSTDQVRKYTEEYIGIYKNSWKRDTKPFDGIPEMLRELQASRINLMILSNKRDDLTKYQTTQLFTEINFSDVRGAVDGIPKKPDPSTAVEMMNAAGSDPGETMFIGDSGVDMMTGINAGMSAGGVLWGFRNREELENHGADHLFEKPADIIKIIR